MPHQSTSLSSDSYFFFALHLWFAIFTVFFFNSFHQKKHSDLFSRFVKLPQRSAAQQEWLKHTCSASCTAGCAAHCQVSYLAARRAATLKSAGDLEGEGEVNLFVLRGFLSRAHSRAAARINIKKETNENTAGACATQLARLLHSWNRSRTGQKQLHTRTHTH